MAAVILVEGESDRVALLTLAERMGAALPTVVQLDGAQAARRVASQYAGRPVLGLVDAAERRYFDGVAARVFVCRPDLEGEFIRALGVEGVEAVLQDAGELHSFRGLQRQPAQRERPVEAQLARFFAGRSGNKLRYARLMSLAVALDRVPRPLAELIDAAR